MNFRCPVCFFTAMPYPPEDYNICPCCGTEFGNDDAEYSLEQLRNRWIANGAHWFYEQPPARWNPWDQLIKGGAVSVSVSNHAAFNSVSYKVRSVGCDLALQVA